MKILLTICARGGSKSVPNKNIRETAGKPLIEYTIDVAKAWGKADKIICSTDSEKIAEIAKKNGVLVPFTRPDKLADDHTGKVTVVRHAFKMCEKIYGEEYDLIVDLDVSSPLRSARDLDACLEIFNERNPDLIFSVTESHRNPYFNMVELDENGFAKLVKEKEGSILRRQDTPKVYDVNASIYFYSRDFLLNPDNVSTLSAKRLAVHEMDKISGTDIDSEADFEYIEFLIKKGVLEK